MNKRPLFSVIIFLFCTVFYFASCKSDAGETKKTEAHTDSISTSVQDSLPALLSDSAMLSSNNPVLLKFNPSPGKVYTITSSNKTTITNTGDGMPEQKPLRTETQVTFTMAVKNKSAQNKYTIELIQKNSRQTTAMGDEKMEYVSGRAMADPQEDKMRQALDCMINSPFILTMNDDAEIENISGLENVKSKIRKIVGDSVPEEMIEVPDPSEEIENFFLTFPDSAVIVGSTWKKKLSSAIQGLPVSIINHYTVLERNNGMITIEFKSNINIDKSQVPKEYQEQLNAIKLAGTVNGTLLIEESTGWTMEVNAEQNIQISQEVQGQKASTNMKGVVTLRSL